MAVADTVATTMVTVNMSSLFMAQLTWPIPAPPCHLATMPDPRLGMSHGAGPDLITIRGAATMGGMAVVVRTKAATPVGIRDIGVGTVVIDATSPLQADSFSRKAGVTWASHWSMRSAVSMPWVRSSITKPRKAPLTTASECSKV